MVDGLTDPNWRWDGQRWLYWDGTAWVDPPASASPTVAILPATPVSYAGWEGITIRPLPTTGGSWTRPPFGLADASGLPIRGRYWIWAAAFGLIYLAFGIALIVVGVIRLRSGPLDESLGVLCVCLGVVLTPTAALYLWKVLKRRDEWTRPST